MSSSGDRPWPPDAPAPQEEGRDGRTVSQPLRLLLVRHARSTWNELHRIQGQLDPPLSDSGLGQARRLGERLHHRSGWRPAGFYSSDLVRCRQTSEAVSTAIGLEPIYMPELREIALGEWEGLTREDLMARYPALWERWVSHPDWDLVPGGELAADFEERVSAALDGIRRRHESGDVLIVTHGGVIQVALGRALGWPGSRGAFPFRIQNTSLNVLEMGPRRAVISRVNDTAHLDDDPIPA
jgi:broad specificity phosphatase PhoE